MSDDQRLAARLHATERPVMPDPAYVERVYADARVELGFGEATRPAAAAHPRRRRTVLRLVLAAAALLAILGLGLFLAGALPDHLAVLRARGTLSIAVRPDFPQAQTINGLEGFDIDLARALASRLGLKPELSPRLVDAMWKVPGPDIALPSDVGSFTDAATFVRSRPYLYWPVWLAVPIGSSATTVDDLTRRRICTAAGASGESWLGGSLAGAEPPPAGVVAVVETDEEACITGLASGRADAMVTSTLLTGDLATRGLRSIGQPVLIEPHAAVLRRSDQGDDSLVGAIDAALAGLGSDGTLGRLSQNRFGGEDLARPPG